ncbi:MAG: alanine racemase [Bacillota bacterium]|nr:alanine racemase [Bacillota bacterium]
MNREYRNYVQIDLDKIDENYEIIRKIVGTDCKIMTVVKADAYGHGLKKCSAACESKTDWFATATLEEAIAVRSAMVNKPILIFGPINLNKLELAYKMDLTLSVGSEEYARKILSFCEKNGAKIKCHIKLDTGLNRMGITCRRNRMDECVSEVERILAMKCFITEGIYTHLSCADSKDEDDISFTREQFSVFTEACGILERKGCDLGLKHCCSTTGIICCPEMRLDMVRTGMLVFGQGISNESVSELGIKPILTWHAKIARIRNVEAGESIGYGRAYITKEPKRIAVVSAGYADGFKRNYSNKARVIINGHYAPVLGNICMDYFMADVSQIKEAGVGDDVILLGSDGSLSITANELSDLNNATPGDVTCSVSARVPRLYYRGKRYICREILFH